MFVGGAGAIDVGDDAPRRLQKDLAHLGRLSSPRRARKQLDAEFVLKLRDPQAQRCLLHVKRRSSTGKASGICGQNGVAELPNLDRHAANAPPVRSEEHTSELQSLMRLSYA